MSIQLYPFQADLIWCDGTFKVTFCSLKMETLLPEAVKNRETLADVKKRARLEEAPPAQEAAMEAVMASEEAEEDAEEAEEDAEGDVAM
jgi:hypothetical protein